MLPPKKIEDLEDFVGLLLAKPELLHTPELQFFREYLESLGAKIPAQPPKSSSSSASGPSPKKPAATTPNNKPTTAPTSASSTSTPKSTPSKTSTAEASPGAKVEIIEEEDDEEEFEEDGGGDMMDADEPPDTELMERDIIETIAAPMADMEISEANQDQAMTMKGEGFELQNSGDLAGAIAKYTEAIRLNPLASALYTSRAACYLKMKRPQAAIQDATIALGISPNSAKAFKLRGKAYRHLGEWEKCVEDLRQGQKIDYDEDTAVLHKLAEEKVKLIAARKRKHQRARKAAHRGPAKKEAKKTEPPQSHPTPMDVEEEVVAEEDSMEDSNGDIPMEDVEEPMEADDQIWEADTAVQVATPDVNMEVSEESQDKAMLLKAEAAELQASGDFVGAISKFTEAISLNPGMPMLYAGRAACYMGLKKPNAAIGDCSVAIGLNPNSAKAYKVRGTAYRHLGKWENSALDLRRGQQIDFDDHTAELHKIVEEHAKRIFERRHRAELAAREREEKRKKHALEKRQAELRKQRERELREEQEQKARAQQQQQQQHNGGHFGGGCGGCGPSGCGGGGGGFPGGFPGAGMPGGAGGGAGMGGMPQGMQGLSPEMLAQMMGNPQFRAAFGGQ